MAFKSWKNKKKGITLVELLLVIALVGPLIYVVANSYITVVKVFFNQNARIDLESELRIAIDDMSNTTRSSSSIIANCSPCGGTSSDDTNLVLELWPIDENGDLIDPQGINYDYVHIRTVTDQIIKTTYPSGVSSRTGGNDILVSSGAQPISITYDNVTPTNAGKVIINISAQKTIFGKTIASTQSKEVKLRNRQPQ